MKVAPAVAEVLGVGDDAAGRTEGYGEVLSVAHAPDAPPAAAPAAPVVEEATAPRPAEMERGPAAADEVQPGAGGARGSIEFLGRWNEKYHYNERAMPIKMRGDVRVALGKLVDELVQHGESSGILVIWGQGQFPGPPARMTRATSGTVRPTRRRGSGRRQRRRGRNP